MIIETDHWHIGLEEMIWILISYQGPVSLVFVEDTLDKD